jgi:hypothetical protein
MDLYRRPPQTVPRRPDEIPARALRLLTASVELRDHWVCLPPPLASTAATSSSADDPAPVCGPRNAFTGPQAPPLPFPGPAPLPPHPSHLPSPAHSDPPTRLPLSPSPSPSPPHDSPFPRPSSPTPPVTTPSGDDWMAFRILAMKQRRSVAAYLGALVLEELHRSRPAEHPDPADDGGPQHRSVLRKPNPLPLPALGDHVDASLSARRNCCRGATRGYGPPSPRPGRSDEGQLPHQDVGVPGLPRRVRSPPVPYSDSGGRAPSIGSGRSRIAQD